MGSIQTAEWENYLTNALKYSPRARPITVCLDVEGQQAEVWVCDEGLGLPPEEQTRIRCWKAPSGSSASRETQWRSRS
jgi:signal transduction histidine kinase